MEILLMINMKVMENQYIIMEIIIQENLRRVLKEDMEQNIIKTIKKNMMENLIMINIMEMEYYLKKMENIIKVNLKMD